VTHIETTARPTLIRLHAGDDVAIATADLDAGTTVVVGEASVVIVRAIGRGHKVALHDVGAGRAVHKYGQVIGYTTTDVRAGEHVHTHNLEFRNGPRLAAGPTPAPANGTVEPPATFQGIVRADGRVATRNYLGILTSVNCSATAARLLAREITASGALDAYPGVDGVVALTHGTGCGMDHEGEGLVTLRRTLSGYARHPNFAGILLLGLGCEVNQVQELAAEWDVPGSTPVDVMTIQGAGGTRAAIAAGRERLEAMLGQAGQATRQTVPASELVLGLQCGGSDGFSGLTANPALGVASDLLVRQGGTSVLGETPEIYGAEHLLLARAVSPEVGERLEERIRWWESYTAANGGSMDNNPSPGNKEGGLTTILEKSLGAVAKGGKSPLSGVFRFAEPVTTKGFVFMDTPGYDPVSVTGMVAGGANIVCFTTGRGSAFGCKPVPSLKLSTTTDLYRRMPDDMDINCGAVLDGEVDLDEMASDQERGDRCRRRGVHTLAARRRHVRLRPNSPIRDGSVLPVQDPQTR
jgi:altronate hydrolase